MPTVLDESHLEMLSRQIQTMEERMIDPREFGRMEQEVKQLTLQMETMQATLTQINKTLNEARGGWRVMMLIGGAGAGLGGLLTWVFENVKVGP